MSFTDSGDIKSDPPELLFPQCDQTMNWALSNHESSNAGNSKLAARTAANLFSELADSLARSHQNLKSSSIAYKLAIRPCSFVIPRSHFQQTDYSNRYVERWMAIPFQRQGACNFHGSIHSLSAHVRFQNTSHFGMNLSKLKAPVQDFIPFLRSSWKHPSYCSAHVRFQNTSHFGMNLSELKAPVQDLITFLRSSW